jgi:hypothetical protein
MIYKCRFIAAQNFLLRASGTGGGVACVRLFYCFNTLWSNSKKNQREVESKVVDNPTLLDLHGSVSV